MSKFAYWTTLGPGFLFIGCFPLVFQWNEPSFIHLTTTCLWLGAWVLVDLGLYHFFCHPKTKIVEGGLMVRGAFYRWEEFTDFKIEWERSWMSGATVEGHFLYLHLKKKKESIKVRLGKRDPKSVRVFLQSKFTKFTSPIRLNTSSVWVAGWDL